jgi:hypothetical protein
MEMKRVSKLEKKLVFCQGGRSNTCWIQLLLTRILHTLFEILRKKTVLYIHIYIEGRQHSAKQQGVSVAVFIWNAEACLQRVREELKCGVWWAFLRHVWRLMRSICHVCVWVRDRRKVGRGRKDEERKEKKERKGRGVRN